MRIYKCILAAAMLSTIISGCGGCSGDSLEFTPQQLDSLARAMPAQQVTVHREADNEYPWIFESVCYTDDKKTFYPLRIKCYPTDSIIYVKGSFLLRYKVVQKDKLSGNVDKYTTIKQDFNWNDVPEIKSTTFTFANGDRMYVTINNRTFFNRLPTK